MNLTNSFKSYKFHDRQQFVKAGHSYTKFILHVIFILLGTNDPLFTLGEFIDDMIILSLIFSSMGHFLIRVIFVI